MQITMMGIHGVMVGYYDIVAATAGKTATPITVRKGSHALLGVGI